MTMLLHEDEFELRVHEGDGGLLTQLGQACEQHVPEGAVPVRFVVTATTASGYQCECGVLGGLAESGRPAVTSIFEFRRRLTADAQRFNTVLLVPTGVGAEIGGHAGDAGPVARMVGEVSDTLVLHPNVVNASDLNEMPPNALYVEGSVVTRLLMGTVGLSPVRSNRVLVVIDAHRDELFVNAAVNTVSGARAAYGLSAEVVCLDPPVELRARYAPSGRAAGSVEQLEGLCRLLEERKGKYDAVALSSVIDVPHDFHQDYFDAAGEMLNPWGGVEAMLTHTLSSMYNIPTAHCPMFESREIANMDPGIVDPRMAAEAVSATFLHCTLKGLRQSPRIVTDPQAMSRPSVFTAEDVSCLVIPDGCVGLPTLAALEQGIPVVAVRENRNIMKNDLTLLPWSPGQFHVVENYWEAAGVLAALRAGLAPDSVRRPLRHTVVETRSETARGVSESRPLRSEPSPPQLDPSPATER
ncbi:MAG: DUF3326 domain-containing protein [Gemmatimonadales bacterium]|nr:DUF3326 domain-containing protein [Gemmatimonadales bacterium]NIQ98639.1 DUF3326 domain-containing protein [Gemmatimonadales bacterium]